MCTWTQKEYWFLICPYPSDQKRPKSIQNIVLSKASRLMACMTLKDDDHDNIESLKIKIQHILVLSKERITAYSKWYFVLLLLKNICEISKEYNPPNFNIAQVERIIYRLLLAAGRNLLRTVWMINQIAQYP